MPGSYLDSSAIVKLAIDEPHSLALRRYLRRRGPLLSSALARAEVLRALLGEGEPGLTRGRVVLGRINLIRVNDRVSALQTHCCARSGHPSMASTGRTALI